MKPSPKLPSSVDLLVVGAGVHGAAIARDAAARGLSVLLVEKDDFGWATSSRSSKLAHGGLRYLEHFQVGLVRESLRERDTLMRVAPHLSWPLPFLVPLSGPAPRAGWKVRIGLTLYDLLAGASRLAAHRIVRLPEALELAPALAGSGLRHAAEYHDAGMDDLRIVIELVVDAAALGARCLNHARVRSLVRDGDRILGARIALGGAGAGGRAAEREVRATTTVLACGPWTDQLAERRPSGARRLVLSKGVHVFVRRELVRKAALFLATPEDGRVFFLIPWKSGTLVGTTDTLFRGAPERARPARADVAYLLRAVNRLLPGADLVREEIVAAQAGLRPLVVAEGKLDEESPMGSVSRDYQLDTERPGLIVVEGGKYTIFRRLAERVVDEALRRTLRKEPGRSFEDCTTTERRLPGASGVKDYPRHARRELARLRRTGLPGAAVDHLVGHYGTRARRVVELAAGRKALLRPACDEHPHLPVEALFALQGELATSPADALLRRLDLPWWSCGGSRCRASWERVFRGAGFSPGQLRAGFAEHEEQLAEHWRP